MTNEDTQEFLETTKSNLEVELTSLRANIGEIKGVLDDLKVQLYAKFGDNINLEAD